MQHALFRHYVTRSNSDVFLKNSGHEIAAIKLYYLIVQFLLHVKLQFSYRQSLGQPLKKI